MAVVLSCVNLKGGVGKTALAVNFAAYCGKTGYKTLLVDMDAQTNATLSCVDIEKWEKHAKEHGTVANLLGVRRHTSAEGATKEFPDVLISEVFPGVDLIPSHLDLFTADLDLARATARETKLRRALTSALNDYDVVVCDCPPNLSITTQNALAASTHYVVPISPDYLSAIGVGLLLNRVKEVMHDLEHELKHVGIIISRVGRPALHRERTVATLRKQFKDLVFTQEIKERVAIAQSAEKQVPVYNMGDNAAAIEFGNVSRQLLIKLGLMS